MNLDCVLILSSGVALGAYIPPLIINNQLKSRGINTKFFVIETLISKEKTANLLKNKFAFHRDFRVALMGQKLSERSDYGIDKENVLLLYIEWDKLKITRFLIFSGFWLTIVENYLETRRKKNCLVDLCHLDASISASWKNHDLSKSNHRNIWFFNLQEDKVNYYLKISNKQIKEFKNRNKRLVIHGGGWGMGTYKEKIRDLTDRKIKLDIINYEINDIDRRNEDNRNFLIDPGWEAWEKYDSKYIFPPFKQIKNNDHSKFAYNTKYPSVYDLIRNNYGIISKPGGATLIDSFSSATPIILLEPFGDYEKANAVLWKKLGFGIEYEQWILMDCSSDILLQMHNNILKMLSRTQNIIDLYV